MGFTRFALSTSGTPSIEDALALADKLGLDAVEVNWREVDEQVWKRLVEARGQGLVVSALDLGPVAPAEDPRTEFDRILAFTAAVSCRRLVLTCAEGEREWFDQMVAELADRCERPGLSVVVRQGRAADTASSALGTVAELRDVLARSNRGPVAAEIDLSAVLCGGEEPDRALASVVGRLGYARLGSDAARLVREQRAEVDALLADLQSYGYGDVVALPAIEETGEILERLGGSTVQDRERVRALQRTLAENELDAAVLASAENVLSLSGYWPMNGTCVAIVPRTGEPRLLVPAGEEFWAARSGWANIRMYQAGRVTDQSFADTVDEQLRGLVDTKVLGGGRIGVEGPFRAQVPPHMAHEVSGRHETIRPVIASALNAETAFFDRELTKVRARKTAPELAALRRSAEIADVGLRTFRDGLADGVRDIDLATEVERAIERFGVGYRGASRVRGYAFVMSGPQTSQCHLDYEFSSTRRMREGEWVLMELAVVADGYWQDLSRVFVIGEPDPQQRAVFEAAESAFEAARRAAVPGATGAEVDAAARNAIECAGYAENYPHQTGHGVGVAFHEQFPLLKPEASDVLEDGHVIAIEPGVYIPGIGGVRNEDNLVVGDPAGATSLQSIPHEPNVVSR
ncbi:M24 family metallopeptidase [Sciscionella sediminilitoris]|uniref:M24 family metallopeptidase n=1 Tax=Sciscionella sediminilitoris TaxID=1445613 RepID=UPI0004DF5AF4|nr:Xaa-Pro peptidase family protein [Sciscionella sp. SE31]